MSLSDRLLRAVERHLLPWFSRAEAERAMIHSEELRQQSIKTRIEAQRVIGAVSARTKLRADYELASKRLER